MGDIFYNYIHIYNERDREGWDLVVLYVGVLQLDPAVTDNPAVSDGASVAAVEISCRR